MQKIIWLYLSSFGIMFAVLSWLQEGGILPTHMGWNKGFLACICGTILYVALPRNME